MNIADIDARIDRIEQMALISHKSVLTLDEAARYLGISKSDLYHRTSNREIPFYKPTGKMIYFDRLELENFLKQNKVEAASKD